jgi:FkbM family methyltransferase
VVRKELIGTVNTLKFIVNHPLNRSQRLSAILNWLKWQIGSRLVSGPVAVPFVNNSRLLVSPGMTGATGNIYCGLHEFEDMAFVLHFLRFEDLFVDVGANIGAYTVCASAAVGAKSLAIEPIPETFSHLAENVRLNSIDGLVDLRNIGVADKPGELSFTFGLDTVNHVVNESADFGAATTSIEVETLDSLLSDRKPLLIKLDVEGYETSVIEGAETTLGDSSLSAVIMELNGSGKRYGFDEGALHKRMLDYGFSTFAYSPFDRGLISLDRAKSTSGNTLYIKNIKFVKDRVATAPQFHVHGHQL